MLTRNRRAFVALLLIVIGWELSGFIMVGQAVNPQKWRLIACWSIIVSSIVLASGVLTMGRLIGQRYSPQLTTRHTRG